MFQVYREIHDRMLSCQQQKPVARCHQKLRGSGYHWLHDWFIYNTRVEDAKWPMRARIGVNENRFIFRWGNWCKSFLRFHPCRTCRYCVWWGGANTTHMIEALSAIFILPCITTSPMIRQANLICHRFQLLTNEFWSYTSSCVMCRCKTGRRASWAVVFVVRMWYGDASILNLDGIRHPDRYDFDMFGSMQ